MKNVLNVIADVLTLMAVCVAAIGHVLPWFNVLDDGQAAAFQVQHASRSGTALAVLFGLICLSLAFNWGPTMRRLLNLAMFISAFAALLIELLVFSVYPNLGNWHPHNVRDIDVGFLLAMVPTCVAVFLCLVRMLWTMPPTRPVRVPSPADLDKKPALGNSLQESGFADRKGSI